MAPSKLPPHNEVVDTCKRIVRDGDQISALLALPDCIRAIEKLMHDNTKLIIERDIAAGSI